MKTDKRQRLKELLAKKDIIAAPGCYDGVTARIVENLGFDMMYFTGFGQSASLLGLPDLGFVSMKETVNHVHDISMNCGIPILADADTGYGGALNIWRTTQEFIAAGAAAIHIEDQYNPKKCGGIGGREMVPVAEACRRIETAREAAHDYLGDDSFTIVGRTDSCSSMGIEEANRRMKTFLKAGADLVMLVDVYTVEDVKRVTEGLEGKLVLSIGRTTLKHDLSLEEYAKLGVKIALYPVTGIAAYARAVSEVYGKLYRERRLPREYLLEKTCDFDALGELMGLSHWQEISGRLS